jgi:hypothetical protein
MSRRLADELMDRYKVKIEPWDESPKAEKAKP